MILRQLGFGRGFICAKLDWYGIVLTYVTKGFSSASSLSIACAASYAASDVSGIIQRPVHMHLRHVTIFLPLIHIL